MNICKIQKSLLDIFNEKGMSTTVSIANSYSMTQSTVHRALKGHPKRMTSALNKLCKYADLSMSDFTSDPGECDILMSALRCVWDGTEVHAKQLAKLLIVATSCKLQS
jgi:hypothetical protein